MRGRPFLALLLLAVVALTTAGPLLLGDACGDDCPPDCGDCIACAPLADRSTVPILATRLSAAPLAPPPAAPASSSAPRQLDHVPLRTVA
jgi:hypothetical protein